MFPVATELVYDVTQQRGTLKTWKAAIWKEAVLVYITLQNERKWAGYSQVTFIIPLQGGFFNGCT